MAWSPRRRPKGASLRNDARSDLRSTTSLDHTRRERTARLLAEAHDESGSRKAALEDEVIRLNLGVAKDAARRYRGRGISLDDLEQVASLGLVKAVRAFDPTRAVDLLSFAVPTIRGELRRYFRDAGWVVRPPRSVQETQAKVAGAEAELVQSLGRTPGAPEIAAHLGVEPSLVHSSMAANGCFAPTSLDQPVGEGDEVLGGQLGGEDHGYDGAEARAVLREVVPELTERERLILGLRFFSGLTQAEIGERVGVTQMQVSRLLSGLLARLRERLGAKAA